MAQVQKAWVYREYGTFKDGLILEEFPVPQHLKPDEVLVKVHAAALNPVDWKRGRGYLKAFDPPLPHVPGFDVAGVVVKVGSEVKRFKEGDDVYGDITEAISQGIRPWGSLAQYTPVEEKVLALKPKNLSYEEAASIPLAVLTAQQGLEKAELKEGQTVLVTGGAGGVGSFVIQLAKKVYGASLVATTASKKKHGVVTSLGADVAIDYTTEDYLERPEKYDVVYDAIGDYPKSVKAVKDGGKVIVITAFNVEPPALSLLLTSHGDSLEKLTPYFESGKLKPLLDPSGPYKFSDVLQAFAHLETGRATGKIVITAFP